MKGALGVALGCALGAVEAKVVKWGRDVHERSWSPPQQTLGVMPELFNAPPLPTPAPLVPKRALEKRGATDNTCAYVGGTFERSLYCDTTAYCASNSLNSHVGCCDDTRSSSCTVWTTCLAMSESAKYTTNNGLTLWCGFSDYPNCITHIYADSTSKASALNGYTLLGCAVAQGSDKVYYNAFTQTKVSSSKITLTPNNPGITTISEPAPIPKNTLTPPSDPNGGGGGGVVVSKVTTYYDIITSNGVVYTTAIATATVPASGVNSGSGSSSTTKSKSTPIGAIAGGVVGGVAAISLIAFALWYLMRRNKKPEADVPSPPPPQPTIPVMAQQAPPPPANGYYGRESIAKPPFDSVSTPSQSPPPPQSPISPYTGSTPSPPPAGGQHASMYGAAALGAAGGFAAAGQYGQQQQQQQQGYGRQSQQYQGYQNQPAQQYQQDQGPASPVSQQYSDQGYQNQPPQQYQNQPPPPQQYQNQPPPPQQQYQSQSPPPPQQQQQYQNQPPPAGYGYQQQQEYDPYPTPHQQQPVYTQGGYAPPPGQRGFASELPTQRGDGEVRELQG